HLAVVRNRRPVVLVAELGGAPAQAAGFGLVEALVGRPVHGDLRQSLQKSQKLGGNRARHGQASLPRTRIPAVYYASSLKFTSAAAAAPRPVDRASDRRARAPRRARARHRPGSNAAATAPATGPRAR